MHMKRDHIVFHLPRNMGPDQGISKYYTTQVVPTRVETLREIAKLAKTELGANFRESAQITKYAKSRARVLTGGDKV